MESPLLYVAMSYRVAIAGTMVEMDTPREVLELLEKSTGQGLTAVTIEADPAGLEWDFEKFELLSKRLPQESLQRSLVRVLYHGNPDGLTREELLKATEIEDAQQIGGALSGLSKNAKALGLPSPINIQKTRDQTGRRTYLYTLSVSFRRILESRDQRKKSPPERELPEFRDYVRGKRPALAGFMEQGAALSLEGDVLTVTARSDTYIRYLGDNRNAIREFASEFFERPITVRLENSAPKVTNGAPIPPELRR
jgi:hypothetical protein